VDGACSAHGGHEKCALFFRNPKGKRLLGRPAHRSEDSIKMDLREIDLEGMDWIHLAQDRDRWRALLTL
jgi:hypothetical protein